MINPQPHIGAMAPYALADLSGPSGVKMVSLSQNESLFPPSPLAIDAGARAMAAAHLYPDPDWSELRDALGRHHGISSDRILCGNGSLDLIGALGRAFLRPGDAMVVPEHAYPFFKTVAQLNQATLHLSPETQRVVSPEMILDRVDAKTRLVFIANPANPTGTRLPKSDLVALRCALPPNVLLVIDEAYGEFADHLNEPMFDMVDLGNTVILRTFSKAYGLAGLRVGWGLFPHDLAAEVRKVLNPNNVSVVSQAAAKAALVDHGYMRNTCAVTKSIRTRISNTLRFEGFGIQESFANFLIIPFETAEMALSADHALRHDGLLLRAQGGAGLQTCLRATICDADVMDRMVKTLSAWQQGDHP